MLTTIIGVFLLAQRDHEHPGEADAKVVPSSSAQEFHKRMSSIGRMESPRSTDKGSEKAASRDESEDQEDKPPMPMSLQYQYLAITDVYNAIRDGLATPEWHHSDSSPRRRASLVSSLALVDLFHFQSHLTRAFPLAASINASKEGQLEAPSLGERSRHNDLSSS